MQGLLHLLKQRGPSSFNTRLSLQIFHAIRYNSVLFTDPSTDYLLTDLDVAKYWLPREKSIHA